MSARSNSPKTIVITGASKGLGEALALAYAAPERRLALVARSAPALEDVARACESRGARVLTRAFDVADAAAMRIFVEVIENGGPIDLLVVNAGEFGGNGAGGALEPLDRALSQLRSNLQGAIVSIDAVVPRMRARRCGQIALISSLAALHPLADAPTYSATKAGVSAYGQALHELLAPEGIEVAVIYPGHIETAQTACHVGPLPLMMQPAQAAQVIRCGLAQGQSRIAFPKRLLWLIWLGRFVPWGLRVRLNRPFRFHVDDGKGLAAGVALRAGNSRARP
jgi:short-subunit dehydrogenase